MKKFVKTLFTKEQRKDCTTFKAADTSQALDLSPNPDTIEKIRRIEESFAMAEQHSGTLRVG